MGILLNRVVSVVIGLVILDAKVWEFNSGLVTVEQIGRQKHYQANRSSPIFQELRGIVLKTSGLADVLRAGLEPLADRITAKFVYGSAAKGHDSADSNIDLMVISDILCYADIFGALEPAGIRQNRSVNPTVYNCKDLHKRIQEGNAFVARVLPQDKTWVLGNDDVLKSG